MTLFLGIVDPGQSGALAVVDSYGCVHEAHDMPLVDQPDRGGGDRGALVSGSGRKSQEGRSLAGSTHRHRVRTPSAPHITRWRR